MSDWYQENEAKRAAINNPLDFLKQLAHEIPDGYDDPGIDWVCSSLLQCLELLGLPDHDIHLREFEYMDEYRCMRSADEDNPMSWAELLDKYRY